MKEQRRGGPQGSSFGPLLWSLFQNDLPSYRGFARGSYVAWQEQWKYEKDIFRDSKKNLLFLACNMVTVQNLYTESENLFMYADDHQMYTTGDSIENATQELKEETEKMTRLNKTKANPTEFQIIFIDPKPSKEECVDEEWLHLQTQTYN